MTGIVESVRLGTQRSAIASTTKELDKDFHQKFTKRFCGWEEAVKSASEVLIDEMRTLLEWDS